MTLLQLRQLVWSLLDDLQGTYFTSAQVNVWLNNALYEVQKMLVTSGEYYYMKCVSTTLVLNQREYVLPEDFYKLHRLEILTTSASPPNESPSVMGPIVPSQVDFVYSQTGLPLCYYIKSNRFVIYPAPDRTYTMRMLYSKRVLPMTLDTDMPDIPAAYHEMLAVLATIDGLLKDGRDPSAMISKREYYEKMMKSDAQQRNVDESRRVTYSGAYDSGVEYFW